MDGNVQDYGSGVLTHAIMPCRRGGFDAGAEAVAHRCREKSSQKTILVSIWNVLGKPRVPGMLPNVSDP